MRPQERSVVCVRNEGYPVSLKLRNHYRVVFDAEAIKHGLVRVVDESGEDYLYPRDYFVLDSVDELTGESIEGQEATG